MVERNHPPIAFARCYHQCMRIGAATAALALGACASVPEPVDAPRGPQQTQPNIESQITFGDEVAVRAIAQVGKPYRYGGADLDGFDCSGLVYFVHHDLGVTVPRTAAGQYSDSRPVDVRDLQPGDLLFFRTTSRKLVTHVGIYAGNGRFVHAPQSGRTIEIRELNDDYYGPRLVGAGRYSHP